MSFFSILKSYTPEDWRNFFITGAAVLMGLLVLYFAVLRKKNKDNGD